MSPARALAAAALLALAFAVLTPSAAAQPDNVYVCVVGVNGCQPGNLAEVHVKNHEADVPDPCYTTACF